MKVNEFFNFSSSPFLNNHDSMYESKDYREIDKRLEFFNEQSGTALFTGIHGTAVPVSMDFHNLREIENRLLASVSTRTVAYAKMFVGILESFIGGLIVLPISLIFMGSKITIQMTLSSLPLLILVLVLTAMASAALGLLVGTIVKPSQIAAMFPGFLMPVVFLGSIFYTWNQLAPLPVMQGITLYRSIDLDQ